MVEKIKKQIYYKVFHWLVDWLKEYYKWGVIDSYPFPLKNFKPNECPNFQLHYIPTNQAWQFSALTYCKYS